jgi:prolipoprotein diacylglyceryl transferase
MGVIFGFYWMFVLFSKSKSETKLGIVFERARNFECFFSNHLIFSAYTPFYFKTECLCRRRLKNQKLKTWHTEFLPGDVWKTGGFHVLLSGNQSIKLKLRYMLGSITWTADPVAFTIPIVEKEIRWYALAFVVGLLFGTRIVLRIWKHEKLNIDWLDQLFFYVLISMVVGARLGHILFYDPVSYLKNPLEILYVWHGGLASHGGTLGILIAVWIYSKKVTHKSMLFTLDRLVVPVGFVAALIRLGNLMNSEVYGHPTTLPWGFKFVRSQDWYLPPIDRLPCHPTQLYEAFFYVLTGFLCLWMYWKREDYKYPGLIFGVFLIGIFLSRFFVEFFKNVQEAFEQNLFLDMGQLLSIPFIIAGFWFACKGLKARRCAPVNSPSPPRSSAKPAR